jgi:carbonic anhydrase
MLNDGHTIRVNYEPGSFLRIGSQRYELQGFHFHTPGEHTFNGIPPDMEIHLVHRDRFGNYAIVAIPVVAGRRHNVILARIWRQLPEHPGDEYADYRSGIKPVFLLPTNRDYVSYRGSLTTPPCTEGVRWFVFRNPVEVPAEYVARFRRVMGRNTRPTQPLNGRRLFASR